MEENNKRLGGTSCWCSIQNRRELASDWREIGQKQREWEGLEKKDRGVVWGIGKKKKNVNEAAKMYEREIQ